jgi:hypothetical protein
MVVDHLTIEKAKEMISKRDRELTCSRENVKRLKLRIRQLEGRKKVCSEYSVKEESCKNS